jgi:hypothetical protein
MTDKHAVRSRQRKPRLDAALKQASKAGVTVASATIAPDGSVSLTFGKPGDVVDQEFNPWNKVLRRDPH